MSTHKIPAWVFVFCLSLTALLPGCQETDYPDPQPATGPSGITSRFRFVNLAPGAPALNFLVENAPVAQNIAYGQASEYVPAPAGGIQIRGRAASGAIGGTLGSNDILFRAGATNQNNFAAAGNASYTVFVTDTLTRAAPTTSGATDPGGARFLVVPDVLTTPTEGRGGVRFLNLSPNGGNLSLVLTPAAGAATTFAARAFRATSSGSGSSAVNFANFTGLTPGTYRAEVRAGTTVVASTELTVAAGKLYTVYAAGMRNRPGSSPPTIGVIQNN